MNEKKRHIKCSEIAKRQNNDDNSGKMECVNRRIYSHGLQFFLTAEFCGKRAKLSKLGKKLHKKMGATDQLCCNSFPIIKGQHYNGVLVYLLPSFKSIGLSVKEKKFKINLQDWACGGHLGFLIRTILAIFDLQVTLICLIKFRVSWPFG